MYKTRNSSMHCLLIGFDRSKDWKRVLDGGGQGNRRNDELDGPEAPEKGSSVWHQQHNGPAYSSGIGAS